MSTVGKSLHKTSYKKIESRSEIVPVSALFLFSDDLHATISLWPVDTPIRTVSTPSPLLQTAHPSPCRKKAKSKILTYPAFCVTELFYFSAIIFPVDFRERCAKLPARIPKNSGNHLPFDMKKELNRPFLQGVQLSPSWLG